MRTPCDEGTRTARRSLIVETTGQVMADAGHVAWDSDRWSFLDGDAPDAVNPSPWRLGRLNAVAGIVEVVPGIPGPSACS